jgi:hypothetical protein
MDGGWGSGRCDSCETAHALLYSFWALSCQTLPCPPPTVLNTSAIRSSVSRHNTSSFCLRSSTFSYPLHFFVTVPDPAAARQRQVVLQLEGAELRVRRCGGEVDAAVLLEDEGRSGTTAFMRLSKRRSALRTNKTGQTKGERRGKGGWGGARGVRARKSTGYPFESEFQRRFS